MATYKVIQDIEAEDKLVGPLTLRQFIYAAIGAICGYICFLGVTKGAYVLLVVFLPIMAIAGFFAFPWKGDQPTEIWALARLRFAIKPRRRIWDQTGIKDYVTITVPKKVEVNYTNGLGQDEVKSRLHTLADVIDSRGWATRNAAYSAYGQPALVDPNSDRLVELSSSPQAVPADNIVASDDMLDDDSSVAHQFDDMLSRSTGDRRKRVLQEMSDAQKPISATPGVSLPTPVAAPQTVEPTITPPAWFTNDPSSMGGAPAQIVAPGTAEDKVPVAAPAEPTAEEKALAEHFKEQNQAAQQISYGHLHVVQPLAADGQPQEAVSTPSQSNIIDYGAGKDKDIAAAEARQKALAEAARKRAEAAVTRQPDPAIIELSNDNDKDIATLARLADKEIRKSPDEVEIRLH